jgi:hypothetical protein
MVLRYLGLDGYRKSTDVVVGRSTRDCHYPAVTLGTIRKMEHVGFPSHTQIGDVKTMTPVLGRCSHCQLRPSAVYSFLTWMNALHHIHFQGHFVG